MQGIPHRQLRDEHPAVQISYSDIRGATQLSEAKERVRSCACALMTFFIIMLALTVLGLFSQIAKLSQTFSNNQEFETWCNDNTEGKSDRCHVSGILDFVTMACFILDLICRGVSIFFYSWGIRAASLKRAVNASSLYRVFWFQLCILGVLSLVSLILAFYAYQLVWEALQDTSFDENYNYENNSHDDHKAPDLGMLIRFGFVLFVAIFIILFASVCACVGCCVYSFKRRTATYESLLQNNQSVIQAPAPHVMQGQVIGAVPVSYVYNQPN